MVKSRFDFLISFALLPLTACPGDDGSANDTTSTMTDGMGTTAGTMATDPTVADTTSDPTGTPGDGGYCSHQCTGDADCTMGGMDIGLTCQDGICRGDAMGCTDDPECVALFSGWTMPCTAGGGECEALAQVCVTVEGGGACATPPGEIFTCDTIPGWSELEVPDIDGNNVTVCGNANAQCDDDGICFSPCQSDADCTSEGYPVCDTTTGLCGCGSDADCAALGQPHLSACNDGSCGCNADQQCVDGQAGDVCRAEGYCGCSGDAACADIENPFDGGMYGCVDA